MGEPSDPQQTIAAGLLPLGVRAVYLHNELAGGIRKNLKGVQS